MKNWHSWACFKAAFVASSNLLLGQRELNTMDKKLTKSETDFLKKLYKYDENLRYIYITTAFLGCVSVLGIIFGIKFHRKDGFLMAIYFGTISIFLIIKARSDRKIIRLIRKLNGSWEVIFIWAWGLSHWTGPEHLLEDFHQNWDGKVRDLDKDDIDSRTESIFLCSFLGWPAHKYL